MISSRSDAQLPPIATVDGWPINIANQADAVASICDAAERAESFAAFTLNLDHLVKLRNDRNFRIAYRRARFVTADGAPIAYLASRSGTPVERTTGADLVEPLCMAASRRRLPVYLLGTSSAVLDDVQSYLGKLTGHRLNVVGAVAPPYGFDPTSTDADRELDRVEASGARLCFLALGAPKQELLAARAIERGIPVGFVCVGAALDFLIGHQVRAPQIFQRIGMEWLWRLMSDPARMAGRYAKCAFVLADIVIGYPLRQRMT